MSMQASTLEILEAADFSPKQARALAQAIDGEIKGVDYLTAPVFETKLDATLNARNLVTMPVFEAATADLKLKLAQLNGDLRVELARLETRLSNRMVALGMTGTGLIITAVFFLVLNLRR